MGMHSWCMAVWAGGIYMLQDFCDSRDLATDEEIRNLVTALKRCRRTSLEKLLREAPISDAAAVADALLHPGPGLFRPAFFDFIEQGDLAFGGAGPAPYRRTAVRASLPQAPRISQLARAEQYAAIELFRGTMASHGAIVYRNDNPAPQSVSFAGHDWLGYVPVRMSDTLCLRERLPPGAAAVLLYPGHTFKDLVMTVDATELSTVCRDRWNAASALS